MEYNSLNLISKVSRGDTICVKYSYLADGKKLSSLKEDGSGLEYRGPFVYRRDGSGALSFESAAYDGGRLTEDKSYCYLTDHLGSTRAVGGISRYSLEEVVDYSAFGEKSQVSGNSLFRDYFTGKEDQMPEFALPYTDFGARMYSPELHRWLSPDPLSEKYYGSSHYSYCANNPVVFVDPDGRAIYYTDSGMIIGEDNEVNDKRYVVVPESYASKTIDELVQLKDYDQSFRYALGLMLIDRIMENDYETVGNFKFVNETYSLEGATLEREGPDTIKSNQKKRIPEGIYHLIEYINENSDYNHHYLLYNEVVSADRRILIHYGNFFRNTDGCILLGPSYDKNADQLLRPTRTTVQEFNNIVKALGPENVLVIINNNFK